MSCHCAELTERGLPPPAGWACKECGIAVAHTNDSVRLDVASRVDSAFEFACDRWHRRGESGDPDYDFLREWVGYYFRNLETIS